MKKSPGLLLNLMLFLITLLTSTIAGVQWVTGKAGPYDVPTLRLGLPYSISILFILGVHEFGHYFASRIHRVRVTLPYFIPLPPLPGFLNFGTMGALIKTREQIPDNRAMFDIGASGPLAGFLACIMVLVYGFTHLPGVDYLLKIHPDFFSSVHSAGDNLVFGSSILFEFLKTVFSRSGVFVPPMSEIYHYPYLCTGWFGLFVTAMNLIPVGQLDGGHLIYSMFNSKTHYRIANLSMSGLLFSGIMGLMGDFFPLGFSLGWSGWLVWALLLQFVVKTQHPPVSDFQPLGKWRMVLGYLCILILILSFAPVPFRVY